MYYILNQLDQVVAVAPRLLNELGIADINTFYQKVALKEVAFTLEGDEVTLSVDGVSHTMPAYVEDLEGMLGNVRVVDIAAESLQDAVSVPDSEESGEISFDDEDLFEVKSTEEENEPTLSIEPDSADELFEIKEPEQESDEELFSPQTQEEELFELTIPADADNAIETIEEDSPSPVSQETQRDSNEAPIYIDVARISEKIGISPEDYNLFLDEYIDTALGYEKALVGGDETKKEEALGALAHLSNVLQLPQIGELLSNIKLSSPESRDEAISSFFTALGRLTTSKPAAGQESVEPALQEEVEPALQEEAEELQEAAPASPTPQEREEKAKAALQESTAQMREPISLENVKPIHFDFQLEEAANDLSLPVELIEEFVNDFISQAHEETEKMLQAYERGDLETVQKIGHLLKGTASNLRINPLSETLYEIQFNDDIDRVPELVRNYWGHFLSLENQIKLISNK